jgi:branched-chain amino acid transport system substrate-binding protein
MLQLSACSGSDHLTNPKYPLSFRTLPCNETAFAMYPWLVKKYPLVKTVAHINPSDESGFTESETRATVAKNVGMKSIAKEFFKRGATDYMPIATKVAGMKPDLIDLGGSVGTDEALAVKALRGVGYKGMIVAGYVDPGAFVELAGRENAEGTILPNTITDPQNQRVKDLQAWYVKNFGGPVPGTFFFWLDPMYMLADAFRKADSLDPVKVAEALRTIRRPNSVFGGEMYLDLESLYGLKSNFCRPIPIGIIKDGKPTHLFTAPWPSDAEVARLNAK